MGLLKFNLILIVGLTQVRDTKTIGGINHIYLILIVGLTQVRDTKTRSDINHIYLILIVGLTKVRDTKTSSDTNHIYPDSDIETNQSKRQQLTNNKLHNLIIITLY